MFRIFLVSLLLAGLAAGAVGAWGYAAFTRPGPAQHSIVAYVEPGLGLRGIADTLHEKGIIANPTIFRLGVRVSGLAKHLQAGEFAFPKEVSPFEAARVLATGDPVVRRVTFAEGLTTAEILNELKTVEGLKGGITEPVSEGSLLPETYHFSYGDTRMAIVHRMQRAMNNTLMELWPKRAEGLPLDTPEQALILASIVEKETGVPAERPRVAAVFLNRLRKHMRLQSDPTVVYGITKGEYSLDRSLTRDDLDNPTPYNTYKIKGLPPGPITNPGRASIEAVLFPADTNELYFVADGSGGHVFATTLAEHNRNVRKWRKIRDQQTSQ